MNGCTPVIMMSLQLQVPAFETPLTEAYFSVVVPAQPFRVSYAAVVYKYIEESLSSSFCHRNVTGITTGFSSEEEKI